MLRLRSLLTLLMTLSLAAMAGAQTPPVTPPATPATPVTPPAPPPPPPPPARPAAAVVLADETAGRWLNTAGIPATVVPEEALPAALANAGLAVIPVAQVRQTATVDALKAFLAQGGKILAVGWGPQGVPSSVSPALASLLNVNVSGWSGKGNAVMVAAPAGKVWFDATGRLALNRGFAVVASPVVPPPPPPPPAPPKPVPPASPAKPAAPGAKPNAPAAKPNTPGGTANAPGASDSSTTPPAPVVPPPPPPPPPPVVGARWVNDAGKAPRAAPNDTAIVTAPGTLWVGEDLFARENDTPAVRRFVVNAAVTLLPGLRLTSKVSMVNAAQARLDAARATVNAISPTADTLASAKAALQAAERAMAAATTDVDAYLLMKDLDAVDTALLDASAYSTASMPVGIRAAWIPERDIPKDVGGIRSLVNRLADAKFNVLLPETVYRAQAAFPSRVYPQDKRFANFDPLRVLLDEAHRRGLEVHPWVRGLAAGEDGAQGPLLRSNPEWAARDKAGRTKSDDGRFWLSPAVPAARLAVRNVVRELAARYDIDGVHLDEMRYQSPFFGYADAARAAFKAKAGVEPETLATVSPAYADWHLWRETQVNSLVKEIRDDLNSVKPGLPLSAAVLPSPDGARREGLQDWALWVKNHWVNWVAPKTFTADTPELNGWLSADAAAVGSDAALVPGLDAGRLPDASALSAQVTAARSVNPQGIAIASAGALTDDMLRALRLGAFRTPAVTPWKSGVKLLPVAQPAVAPSSPPIVSIGNPAALPSARVPTALGVVNVDGRLDDPAWNGAAVLKLDHTEMGGPAPVATTARVMRDTSHLYIGFTCAEPRMDALVANVTRRDGPVGSDDSVEVFLNPNGREVPYYHFVVGANGTVRDGLSGDAAWNGRWTSAVARDATGWTVEIAIPFRSVDGSPSGKWRANVARNRRAESAGETVWAIPYGAYHVPDRFGTWEF